MTINIHEMSIEDYPRVYELWEMSDNIGLSSADSEHSIRLFLERNPGMSFTAWKEGVLVGTVLCGHDGRRGYIHHLMVHPDYRREGIGQSLVSRCMERFFAHPLKKVQFSCSLGYFNMKPCC